MERQTQAQGLESVRRAIEQPAGGSCASPAQLEREIRRLQTRLDKVHARGGAYREVALSRDVRLLLARLDAGATLSAYVH